MNSSIPASISSHLISFHLNWVHSSLRLRPFCSDWLQPQQTGSPHAESVQIKWGKMRRVIWNERSFTLPGTRSKTGTYFGQAQKSRGLHCVLKHQFHWGTLLIGQINHRNALANFPQTFDVRALRNAHKPTPSSPQVRYSSYRVQQGHR